MIGNVVSFYNEYKEKRTGRILSVESEKFDDVKWMGDGGTSWPHYWSKKTKSYRPVKESDLDTIYFEVEGREYSDFIYIKDVLK